MKKHFRQHLYWVTLGAISHFHHNWKKELCVLAQMHLWACVPSWITGTHGNRPRNDHIWKKYHSDLVVSYYSHCKKIRRHGTDTRHWYHREVQTDEGIRPTITLKKQSGAKKTFANPQGLYSWYGYNHLASYEGILQHIILLFVSFFLF